MTHMTDANAHQPAPLRISRTFPAPRTAVFAAWSTADRVKRWFSPETYTVSDATVDLRAGGAFDICMRAPDGTEHWMRGTFVEVTPHSRLVFASQVSDSDGNPLFSVRTEVDFSDAPGGTQMDILQTYTFIDPSIAGPMVGGASEGWRSTLDNLEREVMISM
ncbi:MAG TPA: SRPBCC domain-containing protein [Candidatus Lustribacter sp.]|nr:SRPBCC domain-containing protein [Candidatus Lustribacter sp.]